VRRSTRIALIALAATAGAALPLLLSGRWRSAPPPPAPEPIAAPAPALPPLPFPPQPGVPDAAGELRIASNQAIEIEAASLVPGKPVVVRLVLGEPSRDAAPRPVRVISEDRRVLEGEGALGEGLADARFEIDSAFLTRPGRYVIEIKTTELSHFPLRRYALVVR